MDDSHNPLTTDVENPPMHAMKVDPTRDLENPLMRMPTVNAPNRPLPVEEVENLEVDPDIPYLETMLFLSNLIRRKVNRHLLGLDVFGAFVIIVFNDLLEKWLEEIEEDEANRHCGRGGFNRRNNGHDGKGPLGEKVGVDDSNNGSVGAESDYTKSGDLDYTTIESEDLDCTIAEGEDLNILFQKLKSKLNAVS
ncbi:hypothetical protein LOK49_LG01G00644 [Camellia lanceoleosa]|uniref:Uncharacterized protein n=1 Tax=Camellia lanceoleosa TaxID=1840588 RepID=A0ACC0J3K0_9ERIC|nr:hypothetical protein LOK49_LG01G00644 [Camellia lanceoleosa]